MKTNIYESAWLIALYHFTVTPFTSWVFWLYIVALVISFPRWGAFADWLKEARHTMEMKKEHKQIAKEIEDEQGD